MVLGGLAALVGGGELFLRSATRIARSLGVSESVIAITLVAGGTSLPELASSVVSLLKGKTEMALGNVIGSNIANILLILGVSSAIHPLSMGNITTFDLLMVLLSSLLLLAAAFTFRRRFDNQALMPLMQIAHGRHQTNAKPLLSPFLYLSSYLFDRTCNFHDSAPPKIEKCPDINCPDTHIKPPPTNVPPQSQVQPLPAESSYIPASGI